MFKRMLNLPLEHQSSLFLFGPRGTGKTSWIKANMPNALYIDLLQFQTYEELATNPGRLENIIAQATTADWIVIDEVQRCPELLNEVHRLIELKKYRFLLTGSSARSLRRQGVNLLAGRALRYNMHPLIYQELGDAFNLEHALKFGLLPMTFEHQSPAQYLENYVQTYLREEVAAEGLTRNLITFTRFLEAASFSQGGLLNVTEVARDVGINRLTVANYFSILEDLLIAIQVPVFTKRAKRKVVAHAKFYFFDTGVYRIIRPRRPLDITEEIDGAALETLFLQSLRAVSDYNNLGYEIYFWRTQAGSEVDFITYGNNGFQAFEIKRSTKINNKDLKALKSFGEDYPEAKLYFLYCGNLKLQIDNITCLPFEMALKELPQILAS
ncbi:ATP-binding protein [Candidatus Dependentiae bacterium]|jgi:predicted AAA+ superfamily ATPase|nr:ATP-binding protein [Candidatus Dependentiae bacterium]